MSGTLLAAVAVANVWTATAADDAADRVRARARRDLSAVTDETLDDYPATAARVESRVSEAIGDLPAEVVGSARPDFDEVVIAVEVALAWQSRCVEVDLRGAGTVLTTHRDGPC